MIVLSNKMDKADRFSKEEITKGKIIIISKLINQLELNLDYIDPNKQPIVIIEISALMKTNIEQVLELLITYSRPK